MGHTKTIHDGELQMSYRPAGELIGGILDGIDSVPLETRRTATVLAEVVGDPFVDWGGNRSPSAVATACVYVADMAVRGQERIGQLELAEQAPASHQTIRKHYPEIPSVFFDEADEADLDRVPSAVLDRLRVMRDAYEAGMKLHEIDPWSHSADIDDLGGGSE